MNRPEWTRPLEEKITRSHSNKQLINTSNNKMATANKELGWLLPGNAASSTPIDRPTKCHRPNQAKSINSYSKLFFYLEKNHKNSQEIELNRNRKTSGNSCRFLK